ncbi:hypothetical protein P7C71_g6268, partial [Lecanoromycetidae sp. Uapishka_2]
MLTAKWRTVLYRGGFNPPHRGHLKLLNHVFHHGAHDWDLIAAIVCPLSDVSFKCNANGDKLCFGRNERCLLWKQDPEFPEWAWVYENGTIELRDFMTRLQAVARVDGYRISFVRLYGPDHVAPDRPPKIDNFYGFRKIIVCDAARQAEYQLSTGRIQNFQDCTKWTRVEYSMQRERSRIVAAYKGKLTWDGYAAQSTKEDAGRIEQEQKAKIPQRMKDMQSVIYCIREDEDQFLVLRFVKYDHSGSKTRQIISSTILREKMGQQDGRMLYDTLHDMALSPKVLWKYRSTWATANTSGMLKRIEFDSVSEIGSVSGDDEKPPYDDTVGACTADIEKDIVQASGQYGQEVTSANEACESGIGTEDDTDEEASSQELILSQGQKQRGGQDENQKDEEEDMQKEGQEEGVEKEKENHDETGGKVKEDVDEEMCEGTEDKKQ